MAARTFPGLVVLIPVFALAQSGASPDVEAPALESWGLNELCAAREREDVRDELDRRDIFSGRELRAIRDGEVKTGISLDALICGRGQPASIVEAAGRSRYGPVAAYVYVYLPGEAAGVVAYVSASPVGLTVMHVVESDDPQAIARNPDSMLLCGASECRLVGLAASSSYWPRAGQMASPGISSGLPFPGGRCGERLCDANVEVPPSQRPPPLPPVPDEAQ